jgi:hypothetical protein
VVRRDGHLVVVARLRGTSERFEVPLGPASAAKPTVTFDERVVEPDRSTLTIGVGNAAGAATRYQIAITPSPYGEATGPDRVTIDTGKSVVGKDLYPAGSAVRLSPRDARFSTVAGLPGSGRAKGPASVVIEVSPAASAAGAALVLNLQKTGERTTLPIDGVDLGNGSVRLAGQDAAGPDEHGNPRTRIGLEFIDAAGRTSKVVSVTLASWVNPGAREEGYTYSVTEDPGGATRTGGFVVPPVESGDFHVRELTDRKGTPGAPTREIVHGDQEYSALLVPSGFRTLGLHFHRAAPTASTVDFVVFSSDSGEKRSFTIPFAGPTFRPRLVEDSGTTSGQLVVSLDGGSRRDLYVAWQSEPVSGDVPFLEGGVGHIVLRRQTWRRLGLVVSGVVGPETLEWSSALPDDAIAPPKWQMISGLTAGPGWLRLSDHRFVPLWQLDPQVAGAKLVGIFGQQLAIGYIHAIPVVGELVMLGEAAVGREIITGKKLDPSERALLAVLGGLGLALQGAAALRGASGEARTAALGAQATSLQAISGLSEAEAKAMIQAAENVSAEDRAFIEQVQADVRAGRPVTDAQLQRLRPILESFDRQLQASRRAVIDTIQAQAETIRAARGDLNVMRARVRAITAAGDTAQDLNRLGPQLDQLLTPYRRVRVITGGGRGGAGVSTYIESLDGQFSIRVTHNQVGPNPVGSPPHPRIHLYEGAVTGHGRHVVLADGTTLDDILRALGLGS